jgi:hypothetical protein
LQYPVWFNHQLVVEHELDISLESTVLLNSLEYEKTTVHDHSMVAVKDEVDGEGWQANLASAPFAVDGAMTPLYQLSSN